MVNVTQWYIGMWSHGILAGHIFSENYFTVILYIDKEDNIPSYSVLLGCILNLLNNWMYHIWWLDYSVSYTAGKDNIDSLVDIKWWLKLYHWLP